jgi:hypothetical protein
VISKGRCNAIDQAFLYRELFEFFSKAREEWQGRLPRCLPKNRDRNGEQPLGIVQTRDVSDPARRKIAEDPVISGDQ